MSEEEFKTKLLENLRVPFNVADVEKIEIYWGITVIKMKDGNGFYIVIEKGEKL